MLKRMLLVGALCMLVVSIAGAEPLLEFHYQGGVLPNAPDYDWWYGCSPTSAGMMMGFYDINGYSGLLYNNLVPGGVAELSNYGNSSALANQIIASSGHIADFYVSGYGASGDDSSGPYHSFNSLADFMGTSQDAVGNSNGSTAFFYYTDGSRLYANHIFSYGPYYYNRSGMYGLWEYEQYAGYGSGDLASQYIFNQYIDALGLTYGFSWADYMAEIDAGRPVLIHVSGHTMFGYGYDPATGEVILHDTWTKGEHRMTWGGSYSGMQHYGVTVFGPTGGNPIPEPATFMLLGSGLLALVYIARKRR